MSKELQHGSNFETLQKIKNAQKVEILCDGQKFDGDFLKYVADLCLAIVSPPCNIEEVENETSDSNYKKYSVITELNGDTHQTNVKEIVEILSKAIIERGPIPVSYRNSTNICGKVSDVILYDNCAMVEFDAVDANLENERLSLALTLVEISEFSTNPTASLHVKTLELAKVQHFSNIAS